LDTSAGISIEPTARVQSNATKGDARNAPGFPNLDLNQKRPHAWLRDLVFADAKKRHSATINFDESIKPRPIRR
jgi:hypothetical protein